MARRRRLTAPDAAQISVLGDDPPLARSGVAPIAQVASDAANRAAEDALEARVAAAASNAAAERWRAAEAEGRVAHSVPLGAIDTDHLPRDRVALEPAAMSELIASIRAYGLRTPLELVRLSEDPTRYGLISGWRRLHALRALFAETGEARFGTALALVRTPPTAADAYVAMVEENEIRADLSHYERGRIAVVAAGQGAYASVEAAVAGLFASGSKAKRSKIRSFALIHEELGDLLTAGSSLGERLGLRVAQRLKEGGAPALRRSLGDGAQRTAEEEMALLEALTDEAVPPRPEPRTAAASAPQPAARRWSLGGGGSLTARASSDGATLTLKGRPIDEAALDRVVAAIEAALASER
jgi:ParB family chromosome partitioning protein